MVETNLSFQVPYPKGSLSQYECQDDEIKIFLPEFIRDELLTEDPLIDCFCFSIEHEFLHFLIHKILETCSHNHRPKYNEEGIISSMIGHYRSEFRYGELYYKDYTKYWREHIHY